jgi:hypothetical protein
MVNVVIMNVIMLSAMAPMLLPLKVSSAAMEANGIKLFPVQTL